MSRKKTTKLEIMRTPNSRSMTDADVKKPRHTRAPLNKPVAILFSVFLLLIGLGIISLTAGWLGSSPPQPAYLAVALPTTTVSTAGVILDQQAVYANMAAKQAGQQAVDATQEAAKSLPMGSKDSNVAPTVSVHWTPMPVQPGIFDNPGPLPVGWSSLYHLENRWLGIINGVTTVGLPGSLVEDNLKDQEIPAQGMLLIRTTPADTSLGPTYNKYESPYRCGPLRVIPQSSVMVAASRYGSYRGIAGDHLLLVSTTLPSWFEFDVANRTWSGYGVRVSVGGKEVYQEADPPCTLSVKVPPVTPGHVGPPNPVNSAVPTVAVLP